MKRGGDCESAIHDCDARHRCTNIVNMVALIAFSAIVVNDRSGVVAVVYDDHHYDRNAISNFSTKVASTLWKHQHHFLLAMVVAVIGGGGRNSERTKNIAVIWIDQ